MAILVGKNNPVVWEGLEAVNRPNVNQEKASEEPVTNMIGDFRDEGVVIQKPETEEVEEEMPTPKKRRATRKKK